MYDKPGRFIMIDAPEPRVDLPLLRRQGSPRQREISGKAREVLSSFLRDREKIWPTAPDADTFFPDKADVRTNELSASTLNGRKPSNQDIYTMEDGQPLNAAR
jgi:hypothetical protein